jgi:glutamate-1-semialdehyde aminotransferase
MSQGTELYAAAKKRIPGGTQLLSKRPEMFLPDFWPSYYSKAKGCEVWDLDGNKYTDVSLMGVGANVLGYAYEPVDAAAKEAIDKSGMCTLNAPEEVELADLLCLIHPWADQVRYAKTGGEAMSVAVRIMRASAGKDIILVCGYHGWHDWYLSANIGSGDRLAGVHLAGLEPKGVPKGLAGTVKTFHYNDYAAFEELVREDRGSIAGVVMEPIRNEYPEDDFLGKIREVCSREGLILLFDEISSGFRLCTGGSHLKLGVAPDIAVFAKAMTNGYPLAAVIGKAEVMSAAEDTFISSTFWTERVALAATIKAIREYDRLNVSDHLGHIGKAVQERWSSICAEVGLDVEVGGIYPLSHFSFTCKDALAYKTFFTQEMLKRGYLAATSFYVSLAHDEDVVGRYMEAFRDVASTIASMIGRSESVYEHLAGPVCHAGFQRLN